MTTITGLFRMLKWMQSPAFGGIISRYSIPARNVVGHWMGAAQKIDPGELFDWPRLAVDGIGIWPDNMAVIGAGGL